MLIIAIEIGICVTLVIGIIIALIFYDRLDQEKSDNAEQNKIEFLSTSVNEELLVQNVVLAYYEQQRQELMERQNKMAFDDSTVAMTIFKNNDSGYTSVPSLTQTPHSLYECTGFASMDNLEVSNPLFTTDIFCDNEQVLMVSPSRKK